jgi:hypothetical protein
MSRRRAAIVVLGDAMLIAVVVLLLEIDKLVNGTLYGYGLVFSYDWAQTYWLLFRVSLVLIVVAVILISLVELPHPAFEEGTEEETWGKVRREFSFIEFKFARVRALKLKLTRMQLSNRKSDVELRMQFSMSTLVDLFSFAAPKAS